jgi:hypothetical protein
LRREKTATSFLAGWIDGWMDPSFDLNLGAIRSCFDFSDMTSAASSFDRFINPAAVMRVETMSLRSFTAAELLLIK